MLLASQQGGATVADGEQHIEDTIQTAIDALQEVSAMGIPMNDDSARRSHFTTLALGSALVAIAEELKFLAHNMGSPLRK
jgi:hypothetical protein